MPRPILAVLTAIPLGGCIIGWPWAERPDPHAAATEAATAPMVAECRKHFLDTLKGMTVAFEGGPTVAQVGTVTTVRLEAQPADPAALHALRYGCEFDGGTLGSAGPVE